MPTAFHSLVFQLWRRQNNALQPIRDKLGLGPGQPRLLVKLSQLGPCSQNRLSQEMEADPASVSRMVELLCKAGFLSRSEDEADRRSNIISLTDKGMEAAAIWQAGCQKVSNTMLKGFTADEEECFRAFLDKAARNLEGL